MGGNFVDRHIDDNQQAGVSGDDLDMSAEARARRMGWYPKDEFHGRPEDWIPAEKFIERAEREAPILRENLKRLDRRAASAEAKADAAQRKLDEAISRLDEMGEALDSMRAVATTAEKRGYERAVAQLKKEAKEAAADGDQERVVEIVDKMKELQEAHQQNAASGLGQPAKKKAEAEGSQQQPQQQKVDPVAVAWANAPEREWYRNDAAMHAVANAEYTVVRQRDPSLTLAEVLSEVDRVVQQRFSDSKYFAGVTRRTQPNVNTGGSIQNQGGKPSSKLDKSFESLPQEARAEYARVSRMVDLRKGKPGYQPYTKAEFLRQYHGTETEE
jgi:hypothetical protein